jgi:hypothetical protein
MARSRGLGDVYKRQAAGGGGGVRAAIESTEPVTREFWLRAETARDALRAAIGGER